jgi:hypothetical protein
MHWPLMRQPMGRRQRGTLLCGRQRAGPARGDRHSVGRGRRALAADDLADRRCGQDGAEEEEQEAPKEEKQSFPSFLEAQLDDMLARHTAKHPPPPLDDSPDDDSSVEGTLPRCIGNWGLPHDATSSDAAALRARRHPQRENPLACVLMPLRLA